MDFEFKESYPKVTGQVSPAVPAPAIPAGQGKIVEENTPGPDLVRGRIQEYTRARHFAIIPNALSRAPQPRSLHIPRIRTPELSGGYGTFPAVP